MDTPGTFTIKGACFNGVSAHGQRHVDRGGVLVKIIAKAGVLPTAALFLIDRHAVAVGAVPRSAHHLVADKFQRNTSGRVKLVGVRISDRPCPRRCPDRCARCRSSRLRNTSVLSAQIVPSPQRSRPESPNAWMKRWPPFIFTFCPRNRKLFGQNHQRQCPFLTDSVKSCIF